MKRLVLILYVAFAALLGGTTSSLALAAIGNVVISAFLAVGAGGLLPAASAAAIGAAALGIGLSVANLAFSFIGAKRPKINPNDIKNTSQGKEGPGRFAFGRVELEGDIAFGNTAGYNIYRLILHAFGPLSAIEEYFYDGRSITVDPDGRVSSPPWRTKNGSNLYLNTKFGHGNESSWPQLMNDFSSWTSAHRVRGIAQTLVRAVNPGTGDDRFLKLFQGGIKPVRIRARMGSFFDPRTNTSGWTINGVLHCFHWMRQLPGNDNSIYDFQSIGEAATAAEQLIPALGGSVPLCQLSGGWQGPLDNEIVTSMLDSAGLEVVETEDNLYTLRFIEDNPPTELILRQRHIIDIDYKTGPDGAKRPNICKLNYFSPERLYEVSEIPLHEINESTGEYIGADWARVQEEIDRYGEQEYQIDLLFCCNASQAQRIARRMFHMARSDFGVIKTNFAGLAAWGLKTITIEFPDVGEDGASQFKKCRIGPVRANDEEGTCEIPFYVIPSELTTKPWNGPAMEVPPPPVLEPVEYESELDKPAKPQDATVIQRAGGGFETRTRFTAVSGADSAEAQYRTYTGGQPDLWSALQVYTGNGFWFGWANGDARPQADFRVAFYNNDDEGSYFSDPLEKNPITVDNTAPGAPSVNHVEGGMGGHSLDITSNQLRIVYYDIDYQVNGLGWQTVDDLSDVRPGVTYNVPMPSVSSDPNFDKVVEWRVRAKTSNGTPGAFTEGSYVIPRTGP